MAFLLCLCLNVKVEILQVITRSPEVLLQTCWETLPLPEADDLRIAPPSSKLDVSSLPPPSVTPCPVMAAAEASLEAPAAAEEEDFRRKQLAVRSEEKEAQQAAREEAKNKKKQQKPQAKAKGPTAKD